MIWTLCILNINRIHVGIAISKIVDEMYICHIHVEIINGYWFGSVLNPFNETDRYW